MIYRAKYLIPAIAGAMILCSGKKTAPEPVNEFLIKYSIQKIEATSHFSSQERRALTGPKGERLNEQIFIADKETMTTKECPLVFQNIGPADPVAIMHIDCGLVVKDRKSLTFSSFFVAPRQEKNSEKIELSQGVFATPTEGKVFDLLKKFPIGTKFKARFIRHSTDAAGWAQILHLEPET